MNKRGVTLIALIITIIILLILAGISFTLITGNNSVVNKAVNATEKTNRAIAQQELELAITSVVADWTSDKFENGNTIKLGDYLTEDRTKAYIDANKFTLNEFVLNTEKGVIVTYKGIEYEFNVEVSTNGVGAKVSYAGESSGSDTGNLVIPTELFEIGKAINVSNYGKKVNEYNAKDASGYSGDWRLFYQDSKYAYIITDEAIGKCKLSEYYSEYKDGEAVSIIGQSLNSKLVDSGTFFTTDNINLNMRATAWLTDINKWSDYTDDNGKALYAIGSPTLELFVASFNATAEANGASQISTEPGINGYNCGGTDHESVKPSYSNGIYKYNGSEHLWLASPGVSGNNRMCIVVGSLNCLGNWNVTDSGVIRPIVCIPTSVFKNYTLTD